MTAGGAVPYGREAAGAILGGRVGAPARLGYARKFPSTVSSHQRSIMRPEPGNAALAAAMHRIGSDLNAPETPRQWFGVREVRGGWVPEAHVTNC